MYRVPLVVPCIVWSLVILPLPGFCRDVTLTLHCVLQKLHELAWRLTFISLLYGKHEPPSPPLNLPGELARPAVSEGTEGYRRTGTVC